MTTLAISGIPTGDGIFGRIIVDPHSHFALLFGAAVQQNVIVYILNTPTNKLVGECLSSMPGYTSPPGLTNFAQFAADGESVWTLLRRHTGVVISIITASRSNSFDRS